MPQDRLKEFVLRLTAIEGKVDRHLTDGVTVMTDIAELKTSQSFLVKAFWIMISLLASSFATLFVFVIKFLIKG